MSPAGGTPRLARWALGCLLPRGLREPLLGDLEEEADRRRRRGETSSAVRRWYWRQALAAIARRPLAASPPSPAAAGDGIAVTLWRDLTFAWRGCRRQPVTTVVMALTLALGIGATTTVFSIVDAVLLRPLPVAQPERLAMVIGQQPAGAERVTFSHPTLADLRAESRPLITLEGWQPVDQVLTGPEGPPRTVNGIAASAGLLPLVGLEPLLGRGLAAADDRRGAPPVALVGERLWRQRFAGDPQLLGRTVELDQTPHTVIGVYSDRAFFLQDVELVVPLAPRPVSHRRDVPVNYLLGRLAPGVEPEAARRALAAAVERQAAAYPETSLADTRIELVPFHDAVVSRVSAQLWLLLGAVGCVLAICCVNVVNLLLERSALRGAEVATRRALGASGAQLARQFMTESMALAVAGGAGGVVLAFAGVRLVVALLPAAVPRQNEIAVDLRVLLFALAVALLCGLVFALVPIERAVRRDLVSALRAVAQGGGRARLRPFLVVVEVALAVVLVIASGLLLRTLWQLSDADRGFAHRQVLAVQVPRPAPLVGPEWRPIVAFFEQARSGLARLPGVVDVTAAYRPPYDPGWPAEFTIAGSGRDGDRGGRPPEALYRPVLPGYFRALGIPLLRGRALENDDGVERPGAVVVNEAFVRRFFPDRPALGQRIDPGAWWGENPAEYEIVGVVGDVRFPGLDGPAPRPAMYFAHGQQPVSVLTMLVRTAGDPRAVLPDVRRTLLALDPDLPIEATTIAERLADHDAGRRFLLRLLAAFGVVALLLAGLGLYGVLAHGVTRRRHELGVRMALGARPRAILALVVGRGLLLTALGLVLGLGAAAALGRLLGSWLYGVQATDPITYAAVAAFLAAVAFVASLLPARRATRIDPIRVLRHD